MRPGDLLAVGGCGFKQAPQHRRVEMGYAVLAAYQGQGFATASVAALLRFAFLSGEADEVLAQINPENIASVCVVKSWVLSGELAGLMKMASHWCSGSPQYPAINEACANCPAQWARCPVV
ncbi:GNAT family N-acetyltransferase [Iodobacter fluviatilis]|uniref:GNAT family N-acetyltransferase n=1 Tax=Iodobacter fluviatilis TaxID=537 RepID=UPI001404E368|nr:GNAT family N-acetyltransferase [Iodobacter fluviatilis]